MTSVDRRILRLRLDLAQTFRAMASRRSPRWQYWDKIVKDLKMCCVDISWFAPAWRGYSPVPDNDRRGGTCQVATGMRTPGVAASRWRGDWGAMKANPMTPCCVNCPHCGVDNEPRLWRDDWVVIFCGYCGKLMTISRRDGEVTKVERS